MLLGKLMCETIKRKAQDFFLKKKVSFLINQFLMLFLIYSIWCVQKNEYCVPV